VRDYAHQWLARKQGEVSKATIAAYKRAVADVLDHLGDRQNADLGAVTAAEIASVRDRWAATGSPKTTNNKLKAIRVLFQDAWRTGFVLENVAAKVPALRNESNSRRAFALEELKKVLSAAEGEWRGMVLAGLYTGQRLGDLAQLRWNQVDLARHEIALTTAKTARRVIVPIAAPLLSWLEENAGDDATGPVFPSLAAKRERGGSSPLSQEFHSILVTSGLATERSAKKEATGKGRRAPRVQTELSFHCLRHTATSWLKAAGVSEAIARDIIGHESADVSRHYTHTNSADKAAAVAKLPNVLNA
jgi:integrase